MMVDNITPRRALCSRRCSTLVAQLEPALLQLALVDPRFFSHKQHPARRLLQEITHRSIAFESVDSRGFSGFMEPLQDASRAAGRRSHRHSAEPFDQALSRLVALWDGPAGRSGATSRAVNACSRPSNAIRWPPPWCARCQGRTDLRCRCPRAVLDFLCGPWAQVVAHARMTDRSGATIPAQYAQAIDDLMWSCAAASGRAQPCRRLADGAGSGRAAASRPGEHRLPAGRQRRILCRAGQPAPAGLDASTEPAARPVSVFQDTGAMPSVMLGESVWLAPTEALASGFIDLDTTGAAVHCRPYP
jgi:hypothetical protein